MALTVSGNVLSFDRATPAVLKGSVTVSGLQPNEKLVGLDVRPADSLLYALSDQARLYTLNASTGVATFKVALLAATGDDNPYTALTGSQFGVDFNPAAGQAYLQDLPNNGTLTAPIALGDTFTGANGFDIDARSNTAYAALTSGGSTALYIVPLGSAAVRVGTIGSGEALAGMALMQPTTVKVYALTADSRLASFDPSAPAALAASVPISGLGSGESVLGIDFRPANGKLYALTSTARVLTVELNTGASTVVAALTGR